LIADRDRVPELLRLLDRLALVGRFDVLPVVPAVPNDRRAVRAAAEPRILFVQAAQITVRFLPQKLVAIRLLNFEIVMRMSRE
jgi:hypothetical protein